MGGVEGTRHLGQRCRQLRRVQTPAPEPLLQVAPLDVAHGDEQDVARPAGLVDRDDVRVVDRRGQLRLAQEPVAERFIAGEALGEQLESDPPLEPEVLGQVDDAHAAPAQQRLDPVAGELGADLRVIAHLHLRTLAFSAWWNHTGTPRPCTGRLLQPGFSFQKARKPAWREAGFR